MSGALRGLASTMIEAGSFSQPESRIWAQRVVDPFGSGPFTPAENVLPVGSPLYTSAPPPAPSPEELAGAADAANAAVVALAPTKAKARDLAAALRAAIATGPHALEALAAALEERAGATAPDAASSPST